MAAANTTKKTATQSAQVARMTPSKRAGRKPMSHWGGDDVKKILAERQPPQSPDPYSKSSRERARETGSIDPGPLTFHHLPPYKEKDRPRGW